MKKKPPVIEREGIRIRPDTSINLDEFSRQYELNPGRWDKAFEYLREADLQNLPKGRYYVDETDLYAIIDEYATRAESETRFEAHRNYADIQYIISGEEFIGIVPLSDTTVSVPYDVEKDICFLNSDSGKFLHACPERYFVFFPADAHRPSMMIANSVPVKKVVLKVRL